MFYTGREYYRNVYRMFIVNRGDGDAWKFWGRELF